MIYQRRASEELSGFVKCFWHLHNDSDESKVFTVLPDGYFDVLYCRREQGFRPYLVGLSTKPAEYVVQPKATTFAISFKLPAAEYLFQTSIGHLLNKRTLFDQQFWNIRESTFESFNRFANAMADKISNKTEADIDKRKKKLFEIIYSRNGLVKVAGTAGDVYWSRRQINRYFQKWFGISMKEYCQILRYRSTFKQLNAGELNPQMKYSDQSHFIREVKKYSSSTPKELSKNKNDRFIQLSTL